MLTAIHRQLASLIENSIIWKQCIGLILWRERESCIRRYHGAVVLWGDTKNKWRAKSQLFSIPEDVIKMSCWSKGSRRDRSYQEWHLGTFSIPQHNPNIHQPLSFQDCEIACSQTPFFFIESPSQLACCPRRGNRQGCGTDWSEVRNRSRTCEESGS